MPADNPSSVDQPGAGPVSELDARIAALSPAKRELLARRLACKQPGGADGADVIPPRTGSAVVAVSPEQERLSRPPEAAAKMG